VPLTYSTVSFSSNQDNVVATSKIGQAFTYSFTPNVVGTYQVNSPYLPFGKSFMITVGELNSTESLLSSEYSRASVLGDFEMQAGDSVQVFVDLRDNYN